MLTPLKILKNPRDQWKWLTLKEKSSYLLNNLSLKLTPTTPPHPPTHTHTHPVLLVLTKDYICPALDITIGRFLSEAENAPATNSTFVHLNILRLQHPGIFRNLLQAMKNLHTLYQPCLTTVFSKIFFRKFTCYNTTKLAFYLYVLW